MTYEKSEKLLKRKMTLEIILNRMNSSDLLCRNFMFKVHVVHFFLTPTVHKYTVHNLHIFSCRVNLCLHNRVVTNVFASSHFSYQTYHLNLLTHLCTKIKIIDFESQFLTYEQRYL